MNLSKSKSKGKSKCYYNSINVILFGQSNDNKVVPFISTFPSVGNESTNQQCGSEKVSFSCPKALNAYIKYMLYVELVDYDTKLEVFLLLKVISNDDTKVFLGILNFMLVNRCITWNMTSKISGILQENVDNYNLIVYIAEFMLNWVDPIDKGLVLPLCEML